MSCANFQTSQGRNESDYRDKESQVGQYMYSCLSSIRGVYQLPPLAMSTCNVHDSHMLLQKQTDHAIANGTRAV